MRPVSVRKAHEIVFCQLQTAAFVRIGHDFSAWYAHGIELVVPCRVERIGPVDPLAVGALLGVHAVDRLRISAGPFVARAIRLPTAALKAGVSNGAISLQYIHSRADLSVLITCSEKRLFSIPF